MRLPDLTPKWIDLDVNRHANNVKYIGWIMESMMFSLLQDKILTCSIATQAQTAYEGYHATREIGILVGH
jgi:acyl-ACP thioesterase